MCSARGFLSNWKAEAANISNNIQYVDRGKQMLDVVVQSKPGLEYLPYIIGPSCQLCVVVRYIKRVRLLLTKCM